MHVWEPQGKNNLRTSRSFAGGDWVGVCQHHMCQTWQRRRRLTRLGAGGRNAGAAESNGKRRRSEESIPASFPQLPSGSPLQFTAACIGARINLTKWISNMHYQHYKHLFCQIKIMFHWRPMRIMSCTQMPVTLFWHMLSLASISSTRRNLWTCQRYWICAVWRQVPAARTHMRWTQREWWRWMRALTAATLCRCTLVAESSMACSTSHLHSWQRSAHHYLLRIGNLTVSAKCQFLKVYLPQLFVYCSECSNGQGTWIMTSARRAMAYSAAFEVKRVYHL